MADEAEKTDDNVVKFQYPRGKELLQKDLVDRVLKYIILGNFRQTAFAAAGVPISVWSRWVKIGKEVIEGKSKHPDQKYAKRCAYLARRLELTEALVENQALKNVLVAGKKGDWKASAWYLERRHNKKYSRNPHAHWDDDKATEVQLDAKEILRGKLLQLIGKDDESDTD